MRAHELALAFLAAGLTACQPQAPAEPAPAIETAAQAEPPAPPGEELSGMFRYLADAARFRDCRTGLSFPVAMEGAYIDLEQAYLAAPHEPGAEMLARVQGRYLERPAMEGDRTEVRLIVDRLESLDTGLCEPAAWLPAL